MRYLIIFLLLTACSSMPKATDADPQHAVQGLVAEKQKNNQWCAAAAARMMMSAKIKNLPSQCEIVSNVLGKDCFNIPIYTEEALKSYGFNSVRLSPSFSIAVNTVKGGNPVTIYHKNMDNGHAVVAYGTYNHAGKDYILVYDPYYGRVMTWDSSYTKGNLEWYGLVVFK